MLTDVINLFELLRKLVQRKSELDKEYFENFIEPVWQTFKKVHENYRDSFIKYMKFLDNESIDVSKVREQLLQMLDIDSIQYSDARRELKEMIENTPIDYPVIGNNLLLRFIDGITSYFSSVNLRSLRSYAHEIFSKISKDKSLEVEKAKSIILNFQHYIQKKYKSVASIYYELKKSSLS